MSPGARAGGSTTESILDAAVAELLAVGQADFSMESVAKRAFYSIGTVYNRWSDRDALLADVALERVLPTLVHGIDAGESREHVIDWLLGDGQPQALLAGEILLAGRTSPTVRPASRAVWEGTVSGLGQSLPMSMAWYVATYAVGTALLEVIGAAGPHPARGRVAWFVDACVSAAPVAGGRQLRSTFESIEIPVVPDPSRSDAVARALVGAARELLAERGAASTSTRDIAAGAGVTTGALYRRYDGKSGLLADVLLTQLQPDRYAWTWELVTALATEDPLSDAAGVLGRRMLEVASDEQAQAVLLQLGIAARNDPVLQSQVAERIAAAHAARVDMAMHFAQTGLLRADVAPEVLVWGFQAIPVGVRATQAAGIGLDGNVVSASMEALLRSAAARPADAQD